MRQALLLIANLFVISANAAETYSLEQRVLPFFWWNIGPNGRPVIPRRSDLWIPARVV